MVRLSVIVLITSITALYYSACGARVDTGRNQNPNEWPRDEGSNQNGPGTISSPTSGRSPNESPETNGSPIAGSCFRTEASVLMPALQKLCDENIKINPLLAKIHEYLCVKKFLLSALHQKSCGWHGDPTSLMRHISIYEREPETSGRDYEDVHATILNPPVAAPVYLNFMRLAFENYSEFKRQGFQWISGTRESTNLNQGTLESGVKYKFRVDREAYELGYSGQIQLIQLDERHWIHINYAYGDFVRVRKFAQVALYAQQEDGSVMVVKIEHKGVDSSGGLYNRAWKGAMELLKDFMNKSWTNALRSKP